MKFLNYLKSKIKKDKAKKNETLFYNMKQPYEYDKTKYFMCGHLIKITNVKDKLDKT